MKEKYILALDQGTSSSRAIVFDHNGQIVSIGQKEFTQHFPKPGWVEHDPMEIWSSEYSALTVALTEKGLTGKDIVAVGITNQRETTVVWDAESGRPVYNAIVWQDRRTSELCDRLKAEGMGNIIHRKTGLQIDAYFSGFKIKWILDNVPGAKEKASCGKLRFGTVDSWLLWNLTGGKVHVTDVTNASRTMLFNINSLEWDAEMMKLLDIPESMMPEVRSCSEILGYTSVLGYDVPIAGIAGDQQSALFGQMCISEGSIKNTYGTGCFLLMNTGEKPVLSKNGLLTTVAMKIDGKVTYALEGSVFTGGSVVQWLRDGLGIIKSSSEVEALATSVPDNGGVYVVPAFTGLGAPYWDQYARGAIYGLTRGVTAANIARAALEGIAFQTMDVVQAMEKDSGIAIKELKVDGGASRNNFMMQFQSDILGANVIRPSVTETTALGAAYLAGLATGFWDSISEVSKQWQTERKFIPSSDQEPIEKAKLGWIDAVSRTRSSRK